MNVLNSNMSVMSDYSNLKYNMLILFVYMNIKKN